ncbi:MAG TPA: hypothetical protein VMW26_02505 [Methanomassiliicoccales archaeon]|nr:hypothetical protein [Methanomassiliicoccales archaeon]
MQNDCEMRPKGCYFDMYGAEKEMLDSLTCHNCPLPAMVCDYKSWPLLEDMAKRIMRLEVNSNP